MRIGMILDKTFPPDSRVENEAISLIEAGHEVYLFCLQYGNQKEHEEINGIKVRRFKSNNLEYKLSALAYTFSAYHRLMQPKIRRFIKENGIEAIHIHDMAIAEAVFKVNKQFKFPVTLDLHENRPEIMRHYGHVKSLKGRLMIDPDKWEKKQQQLVEQADKIIVVTKEAKEGILGYGSKSKQDIVVVPNTIHPDIYLKYELDKSLIDRFSTIPTVLYLGDTGLRRGTDTAVKAMAELRKKGIEVQLVLVGNNKSEDPILNQLIDELNVRDVVHMQGWQDVSLFPSYVEASTVCISPLKRNLHHDTTFANKIFQYMAMGKPVVVSDSTAQANVIMEEDCGLVHEAENHEDLAEKLLQLLKNKDEAIRLGNNGRQAVLERWNWKVTSPELVNLYNNL